MCDCNLTEACRECYLDRIDIEPGMYVVSRVHIWDTAPDGTEYLHARPGTVGKVREADRDRNGWFVTVEWAADDTCTGVGSYSSYLGDDLVCQAYA